MMNRQPNNRNKYNARRIKLDGVNFASHREAARYTELKYRLYAGEITNLRLQPRYDLSVNGVKICTYVGDFLYDTEQEKDILEDAKGFRTQEYKLKFKLMKAILGINVIEV